MISISHAPNSTYKQYLLASSYLFLPWKWSYLHRGSSINKLESYFSDHYQSGAFTFSQAREALWSALKAIGVGEGDEVILQAYTCIVVPNAILWTGAKPVYSDIDIKSLNITLKSIEQKLSSRTKAIIVQHNFGVQVSEIEAIKSLCQKHGLYLIEDCAHSINPSNQQGKVGDMAIFSFGRDKAISSTSGGIVITKNPKLARAIEDIQAQSPFRKTKWVRQNLWHPILVAFSSKLMGRFKVGQVLMIIFQRIGLIQRVYTLKEKRSQPNDVPTHRMSNSLAELALQQLTNDLISFNDHRAKLSELYKKFCHKNDLSYQESSTDEQANPRLRFTLLVSNPQKVIIEIEKQGFLLGDWYKSVVMPMSSADLISYELGSCPNAEKIARESLNLPLHHKLSTMMASKLLNRLESIL